MASFKSYKTNCNQKNSYETKKAAVKECLRLFNEYVEALNELNSSASRFARCLQSLDDIVQPEVIGSHLNMNMIQYKKQSYGVKLPDVLDTIFKKISAASEKIRIEVFDKLENFVAQIICPNEIDVKHTIKHNQQLVDELKCSMFSLYNHLLVMSADLMQPFLICHYCCRPIGFSHLPLCIATKAIMWKKIAFDDKFITIGMNFSFDELFDPNCKKNILYQIMKTCSQQMQMKTLHNKPVIPWNSKNWPVQFTGLKSFNSNSNNLAIKSLYESDVQLPTSTSIWTPIFIDNLKPVPYTVVKFEHEHFKKIGE
ncbi:unnamed protein product [Diamesa hyperborea]